MARKKSSPLGNQLGIAFMLFGLVAYKLTDMLGKNVRGLTFSWFGWMAVCLVVTGSVGYFIGAAIEKKREKNDE